MDVDEFLSGQQRRRSPIVLVGALATAGVLFSGLVAFKKARLHQSPGWVAD
jgi:hypothetical protein